MDAADTARGEDVDARQVGADHCRGNGGGARAASRDRQRKIGAREFHYALGLGQFHKRIVFQADADLSLDNGDGCGHGSCAPNIVLDAARGFDVLRPGHTMGNDGALQRDERAAVIQRSAYFRRIVEIMFKLGCHGFFYATKGELELTVRLAVSMPRSTAAGRGSPAWIRFSVAAISESPAPLTE